MTIQKTLTIVNKLGLHARAATQLVKLANQFDAKIILKKGDKEADASRSVRNSREQTFNIP